MTNRKKAAQLKQELMTKKPGQRSLKRGIKIRLRRR